MVPLVGSFASFRPIGSGLPLNVNGDTLLAFGALDRFGGAMLTDVGRNYSELFELSGEASGKGLSDPSIEVQLSQASIDKIDPIKAKGERIRCS